MQELPPGFRIVGGQQNPDPVIAPPDPYKQRQDARQDRATQLAEERFAYDRQRDAAEDARRDQEVADSERQAREAQADAAYQLENTIRKIDTIKADTTDSWTGVDGLGETGFLGAVQGSIPGRPAYSLREDLGTIDATQVLQAMTRLKELSPTGSTGFGALSAPELKLLQSSVARLDPNMDQETFMSNLDTARKVYSDMLLRIKGGGKEANELLGEALRKGASREEVMDMANLFGLEVNEADLDANLRSREAGGPVNEVLPPDIEAIMQKYGAN